MFAVLVVLLLVLIALLTIPVSTVTRAGQATYSYSIQVSQGSPGGQVLGLTFSTLCGETTSQLPLVGNQTFWISWTAPSVAEVRLASFAPGSPVTYYDVANQTSGGYAQSSASTFRWLCGGNLNLLVSSNATQAVEFQSGLVYDYSAHVPLL